MGAVRVASLGRRVAAALACVTVAACGASGSPTPGTTPSPESTPFLPAAPAFVRSSVTDILPGDWSVIATADANEDGKPDVLTTTLSRLGLGLLLGNGDGTFKEGADIEVAPSDFVRAADLDGDGHLDLIGAGEQLAVLRGNGDGTFKPPAYYDAGGHSADAELNVFGTTVADVNGDAIEDVIATNWRASRLAVFRGTGDGTLEPATFYPCATCINVAAADLDGDGDVDLATTSFMPGQPGSLFVFVNDGIGDFQGRASYDPKGNAHGLALADLNADGALDVITGNDRSYTVSVLLGTGDGTFGTARTYPAGNTHSIAVVDVDGDGRLDILSVSIDDAKVWFHRGTGDGSFVETQGIAAAVAGGLAAADMNGDGKPDLVLGSSNSHQAISVYLQQ